MGRLNGEDTPHPFATAKEYEIGRRIDVYRNAMNVAAMKGNELLASKSQQQMNMALDDMKNYLESEGHHFGEIEDFSHLPERDSWMSGL